MSENRSLYERLGGVYSIAYATRFKSRLFTTWTYVSCLLLTALLVISPVPAAATDRGAFAFSTVDSFGCESGDTSLNVSTVISEPAPYFVRTFVDIGPTRYMDESKIIFPHVGGSIRTLRLSDDDSGGPTNGTWPLPIGADILVTAQLSDIAGLPMWESRVTIGSCDASTLINPSTGPVDLLLKNYSFEKAGDTAGLASQWTASGGDDRRVCNKDAVIVARNGECAYRFKGAGTLSQNYKTKPIAAPGDQVRLSANVKGANVAAGSTIKAVVSIPNRPDETITLNVPPGDYEYQEIVGLPVNITKSPDQVTVTIKKLGAGTLLVDDVMLLSVANAGSQLALSPLTLPDAAP